jgi:hypothetical protein
MKLLISPSLSTHVTIWYFNSSHSSECKVALWSGLKFLCWLFSHVLNSFFIRPEVLYFDNAPTYHFSLYRFCLFLWIKEIFAWPEVKNKDFILWFFLRSVMVLGIIFCSMIHLELFFQMCKVWIQVQLSSCSSTHCWKDNSLITALVPLLKINLALWMWTYHWMLYSIPPLCLSVLRPIPPYCSNGSFLRRPDGK